MAASNPLSQSPPYAVDTSLKRLGANLRTARLRRNLTIHDVAAKIGTGPRAVADAEKGKVSTGVVVYYALLWTYGLLDQARGIADPGMDDEGLALDLASGRTRARAREGLDNDF